RQDRLPPEAIAARLEEFARQAATMVDIARTLANERGDDASAEMLFWAEATLGAIESHRRGARLLVGIDVRVSDAVARHARTSRQPARTDEPSRRPPADHLWRCARCTLGNFGIRLQRPRSGTHLSIFELRSPGSGFETRP